MKRLRTRIPAHDAEELLLALSQKQFIRPHKALAEVLGELSGQFGFCKTIAQRAVAWLELDCATSIGRLRRSELSQLARSIHRFWRQTLQRDGTATVNGLMTNSVVITHAPGQAIADRRHAK